jgi:hypothetical protein
MLLGVAANPPWMAGLPWPARPALGLNSLALKDPLIFLSNYDLLPYFTVMFLVDYNN